MMERQGRKTGLKKWYLRQRQGPWHTATTARPRGVSVGFLARLRVRVSEGARMRATGRTTVLSRSRPSLSKVLQRLCARARYTNPWACSVVESNARQPLVVSRLTMSVENRRARGEVNPARQPPHGRVAVLGTKPSGGRRSSYFLRAVRLRLFWLLFIVRPKQ